MLDIKEKVALFNISIELFINICVSYTNTFTASFIKIIIPFSRYFKKYIQYRSNYTIEIEIEEPKFTRNDLFILYKQFFLFSKKIERKEKKKQDPWARAFCPCPVHSVNFKSSWGNLAFYLFILVRTIFRKQIKIVNMEWINTIFWIWGLQHNSLSDIVQILQNISRIMILTKLSECVLM